MSLPLIPALPDFARKPVLGFISRRSGPFDGQVTLDSRRVYILPTKIGILFSLLLIILLLGSVNYGKSLGFVLVFLLAGVGNVAMFATWRNLAGLHVRAGGGAPVFCGEWAAFSVLLENRDMSTRYSIAVSQNGKEFEVVDIAPDSVGQIHLAVKAVQRGLLDAGRFRLYTGFPTGLFVAWTWIDLSMACVVYPRPAASASVAVHGHGMDGDTDELGDGLEEFSGLRKFQTGDSWRRVSWKKAARSDELHTKEFAGGQPEMQWIEWNAVAASGVETRLSIMTRMVMDAEAGGRLYGLKIPGAEIPPDHGSRHYQRCLKSLALYGVDRDG